MGKENFGNNALTLRAPSTAFSARQYRMVLADTTAGYFKAGTSAANNTPIGVLQDAPTVAGEPCKIVYAGVTKCVTGTSTLTPGKRVVMGALGVAKTTGTVGSQQQICGIWLEGVGSTANTVVGTMLFNPLGTWST